MPKTDLKRDILLTAKHNPRATNQEIADEVDCSPSYVSQVLDDYDDYTDIDAAKDHLDRDLDALDDDLP